MRLLQFQTTGDLSLVEFLGDKVPPYAILSHTWGHSEEEVSYHDVVSGTWKDKPNSRKISFCGWQAARDGLNHFWIDTCCIDKSSSADLSEAINSMFSWYQGAAVCYAFLSDVHHDRRSIALEGSKWFTRGWTLQELLAPKKIVFYSSGWKAIGSKDELKARLHSITKIPTEALEGKPLNHFSIAQRMSWASNRETTRKEDIAYSLMGIFDVNMPLLYGEKEKAFLRLQDHILKDSGDQSLFAWTDPSRGHNGVDMTGLLARHPKCFESSGHIQSIGSWGVSDTHTVVPGGIRADLWLNLTNEYYDNKPVYKASLACVVGSSVHTSPAIFLALVGGHKPESGRKPNQFVRIRANELEELNSFDKLGGFQNTIFVRTSVTNSKFMDPIPFHMQVFRIGWDWGSHQEILEQWNGYQVYPTSCWNPQNYIFTAGQGPGALGVIVTHHKNTSTWIAFGNHPSRGPWVKAIAPPESGLSPNDGAWPLWSLPIDNASNYAACPIQNSSVSCEAKAEARQSAFFARGVSFAITISCTPTGNRTSEGLTKRFWRR
ncbi:heterokaryon incompatibility protein-domain-containing protein [Paraphoma chrysanthemicola]|uniref:Heterokaryon incompatibility protein-domain-containing protein n=1 Tax=Paraphoma chrysanthemicola TaxID=798071 RepID=A0A8K0R1C7_9PLEO|nr:heterokaryon incompatibility protein-domain-containing protein [Paraphoma chrysanthemicola]